MSFGESLWINEPVSLLAGASRAAALRAGPGWSDERQYRLQARAAVLKPKKQLQGFTLQWCFPSEIFQSPSQTSIPFRNTGEEIASSW